MDTADIVTFVAAAVDQILECLDHVSLLSGCYDTFEGPVVDGILSDLHLVSLLQVSTYCFSIVDV